MQQVTFNFIVLYKQVCFNTFVRFTKPFDRFPKVQFDNFSSSEHDHLKRVLLNLCLFLG